MSDTPPLGYPAAAQSLGVSVRALRQAIRSGKLPAPPQAGATAVLPAEWVENAKAATETAPLPSPVKQKVPPFARYEGTSAFHKHRGRIHEYARYRASMG